MNVNSQNKVQTNGNRRGRILAEKKGKLDQFEAILRQNVDAGLFNRGSRPIQIFKIDRVSGPRVGALRINAGPDAGFLYDTLTRSQSALTRQLVPWYVQSQIHVGFDERAVRIEAPWEQYLAEDDIHLTELSDKPNRPTAFLVGKNDSWATVQAGLTDEVPHWLVGGSTGAGKTVLMTSIVYQLIRNSKARRADSAVRFILIDGKRGEGLGKVARLPYQVGPIAFEINRATRAVAWAAGEMIARYDRIRELEIRGDYAGKEAYLNSLPSLVVVIDEIQVFTEASDLFAAKVRDIATLGRAAKVHLIVGTQHPLMAIFGQDKRSATTKRQMVGRVALRVDDAKASEVLVGASNPRADILLGKGDSFIVTPKGYQRAQVARVLDAELEALSDTTVLTQFEEYPETDTAVADVEGENTGGRGNRAVDVAEEIALSILNETRGLGRDRSKAEFVRHGFSQPGTTKYERLRATAARILTFLQDDGYTVGPLKLYESEEPPDTDEYSEDDQ